MPDCKNCENYRQCFPVPEKLTVLQCDGVHRVISMACRRAESGCANKEVCIETLDPECGEWFPSSEMPKDHRYGFCSEECFVSFVEHLLEKLTAIRPPAPKHSRRNYNGERRTKQGFRVLDGEKNERRRDGRAAMKGYSNRR